MSKRSVERDVQEFCGWDFLMRLVKKAPSLRHKAVCAGLFTTGCRVSELGKLRKGNVNLDFLDHNLILFEEVPVGKRKKNIHRTFPVRADEPLVGVLLRWFRYCEEMGWKLLFPWSRNTTFTMVRECGEALSDRVPFSSIHSSQLYPHWFRAQRAKQLRFEYDFTDENLRDWFGWAYAKEGTTRMPAVYGGYGWMTLAKKMGIDVESIFGRKKYER